MNLLDLVTILRRRWWLVAAIVLVTAAPAAAVTSTRPPRYVSTGTFVVQPRAADESDVVRAAATLTEAAAINSTFAEISETDLIETRARARLGLDDEDVPGLRVSGSVVSRTNLIELTVSSRIPELSRDMALAVGQETLAYVSEVSDVFALSALDEPGLPIEPAGSGVLPVTAAAALLGLGLAIVVAVLSDPFLRSGGRPARQALEPAETGPYNEDYSRLRIREEMSRSDDGEAPFGLAVVQVRYPWRDRRPTVDDLAVPTAAWVRRFLRIIAATLRPHDHVGHLADLGAGTFVVIVPGVSDEKLDWLAASWHRLLTGRLRRSFGPGAIVTVGSCRYIDGQLTGDELAVETAYDLTSGARDRVVAPAGARG